ncbi:uncharacterized protein LOC133087619 isoform X2 [Eubalaena glacialis]|uniref:uncharacterized protein LOC133087619 isoform X2 n=1 Tax=Eubalaena glacialis TaxID=27606 RepID=UPI002A5A93CD|nr:uncharacterized protein LOC133087619 isoform X2 [Eubalaena glacialis]
MAMSKELTPRLRGPSRGAPMPRGAWPTLPQRKARRSRACPKPAAVARWAFHPGLSAVLSHFPAEIRTPTEPPLLGGGVSRLAPARLLPWTEKALSAQPGCPLTAASVVSGPRFCQNNHTASKVDFFQRHLKRWSSCLLPQPRAARGATPLPEALLLGAIRRPGRQGSSMAESTRWQTCRPPYSDEEAESQSDQIDDLPAVTELVTAASGPELLDPRLLTSPIPGA